MAYEKLNSERVNYLVWRYLQEAGFGQSAARLQRDWGIPDPETLPFASHIGPHGLVRLLQNGLHHLGMKASLSTSGRESTPFFGPATPLKASTSDELPLAQKPLTPSQRRDGDPFINGSSIDSTSLQASATPKRSRRSNGALNGKAKSGEGMDIDEHNAPTSRNENEMEIDGQESTEDGAAAAPDPTNNNAASGEADYSDTNGVVGGASHLQLAQVQVQVQDQEQQPEELMPTLTNGTSRGVQSENFKVTDLGPETAVLNLAGNSLTQAAWNPKHPTLLAAGGRALCQIWSLQSATATRSAPNLNNSNSLLATSSSSPSSPSPSATELTTDHTTSHTLLSVSPDDTTELEIDASASVTAIAWSPAGDAIAYSTFPDDSTPLKRSFITLCSKEGIVSDELPSSPEPVMSLAWNPTGRYLAALAGKTILVYDRKKGMVLPPYETKNCLLDVAWLSQDQLAVCGESIIATAVVFENRVSDLEEYPQAELEHDWSQLRYDSHTATIAVASEESGHLALIEVSSTFHATRAHEATLTGLAYRPMVGSDAISSAAARLLATSSVDGTVKLWNARAGLQHIHTFNLGAAALSLCFTPDGRHVAAASSTKILFWSAQEGGMPKAVWDSTHIDGPAKFTGNGHTNGANGMDNGDVDMEDQDQDEQAPSMTWDSNGHKLALACKDKVTIINYNQ